MDLYSYVVRYDSGFAPNPFYGYCTLATCKPDIRNTASIGDWIIGVGSADKRVNQGGRLVYAMRVGETLSFNDYYNDERFIRKRPNLFGSRKQARGDNIYQKTNGTWRQLDSFHSMPDGSRNEDHIRRDTKVDKVLISNFYVYFGGNGPKLPSSLKSNGRSICHRGIGRSKFRGNLDSDLRMIGKFESWLRSLDVTGYVGQPYDWDDNQK
ncbi:MAG: hypothetical protein ABW176_15475 [Candidatus Thiodiazotropha endolucinida]